MEHDEPNVARGGGLLAEIGFEDAEHPASSAARHSGVPRLASTRASRLRALGTPAAATRSTRSLLGAAAEEPRRHSASREGCARMGALERRSAGKCCRWGNGDIYLSQMGYREFQIQLLIQVGEEQDYTMIYLQILEGT